MTSAPATPEPTESPDPRRRAALVGLFVVLALVWTPSLFCGFTSWDDTDFCVKNPDVAHLDLVHVFDPTNWVVSDWTPLATVTYAAERAAFGSAPWVPHMTNVLLHLVGVGLVFKLLRDVGFGFWTSFGVAAVFGVHPLQVESVTWVAARKNVLVAIFALAFLRSYVAGRHGRATAWFVLALCSKATSVGLPLVAAAAHLLRVGAPRTRATWAWIGGWTVLSGLRSLVSIAAQKEPSAGIAALGFPTRMAYMGSVFTTQARQIAVPTGLSVVYAPPRREWSDVVLIAQWALVVALLVAAFLAARRDKRLAFVGVFALAMLAPTLNVFPAPCLQADRYAHLPMIGIGAFLVAALAPLARWRTWAPAAVLCAWCAVVLAPATAARELKWRSTESLFNDACLNQPESGIAWSNYGNELVEQGRLDDARLALEKAATLPLPKPGPVLDSLAFIAGEAGDWRRASALLDKSLAAAPDDGRAHTLYGHACLVAGRIDDAGVHLAVAARLDAEWANTWLYHAEWNVRTGRLADARADVERARAMPGGKKIVASTAAAVDFLDGRAADAFAGLRAALPEGAGDADVRAVLVKKLRYLGRDEAAAAAMR